MNIANLSRLFFGTSEAAQILKKTVTLTNDQIKALPTTAIELVAAPGVGYRIKIISATVRLNTTAGAYTNVNASYATLAVATPATFWLAGAAWINDDTMTFAATSLSDRFGGTASYIADLPVPPMSGLSGGASSGVSEWALSEGTTAVNVDNQPAQLQMDNNGSGDLTAGHASNSLIVFLTYMIEATT